MTDLEQLIYLDTALNRYSGIALAEGGWDSTDSNKLPGDRELTLLPQKTFAAMEAKRRQLVRSIAFTMGFWLPDDPDDPVAPPPPPPPRQSPGV